VLVLENGRKDEHDDDDEEEQEGFRPSFTHALRDERDFRFQIPTRSGLLAPPAGPGATEAGPLDISVRG
jgi:hypothetical protein